MMKKNTLKCSVVVQHIQSKTVAMVTEELNRTLYTGVLQIDFDEPMI